MELTFINKKLKKIAKLFLVITLSIVAALGPMLNCVAYGADNSGVQWTRMKSPSELHKAVASVGGNGAEIKDYTLNSNENWKKILIVYETGGTYYYLQSSNNDGEKYRATVMNSTTGFTPSSDTFVSRSNLDCLLAKTANSSDKFYLRYSAGLGFSPNCLVLNLKWWGIEYYAAARGNFTWAPISNPSSAEDESGPACNATIECDWQFVQQGDKFEIKWNSERGNVKDRHWDISGNKVEVDSSDRFKGFMVYVGEDCSIPTLASSAEIQPYTSTKLQNYTINEGVEIVVGEGATLCLDGVNYCNGHIYVYGGTLVISGVFDADYDSGPGKSSHGEFNPGDITIDHGGTLIVERGGVILSRAKNSGVYLSDNSAMYVEGTVAVANSVVIGHGCSVRAVPGSFVAVGVLPNESMVDAKYMTADTIAANKLRYLSDRMKLNASSVLPSEAASILGIQSNGEQGGRFVFGNNSSFISQGGVFSVLSPLYNKDTASLVFTQATNINASFNSMMQKW